MASHEKIAQVSLDCFKSLPKTGKPTDAEWTILSAIVKFQNGFYEVVALGTGSKCIGSSKMSPSGDVLNDSHAEIVCRRAFLLYLYNEMLKDDTTLLTLADGKFVINTGIEFHFFTTHAPCGDASIFPKSTQSDIGSPLNHAQPSLTNCTQTFKTDELISHGNHDCQSKEIVGENEDNTKCAQDNRYLKCEVAKSALSYDAGNKGSSQNNVINHSDRFIVSGLYGEDEHLGDATSSGDSDHVPRKKPCLEGDIFRTGAKCLPEDVIKDSLESGINYHVIGAIRTKPGRGDRTLSVSCSDKLAKWCYLGIQGRLLSILLKDPIYLKSFTIAGNTPFSEKALNRALFERFHTVDLLPPYKQQTMKVAQVQLPFQFGKDDTKRPSPSSIIYTKSNERKPEVAVDGRKQGVARKNLGKKSSLLSVCKQSLFKSFLEVIKKHSLMEGVDLKQTYRQFKAMNSVYNDNWDLIKTASFKIWTVKDLKLLEFYDG